jgi:hypothetical protein
MVLVIEPPFGVGALLRGNEPSGAAPVKATLRSYSAAAASFKTRQEAKTAIFDCTEAWYNPARRHSRPGHRSPDQYERDHDWAPTGVTDMGYRWKEQKAA